MKKIRVDVPQTVLVLMFIGVLVFCWITDAPLGSASPVIAALVAGLVALSINETVDSRRKAELLWKVREQREGVYRELVEHMIQSFEGGPQRKEWEVRGQLAVWASNELLEKYSNWRSEIKPLIRDGGINAVPSVQRLKLQEAVAAVCQQARRDLGIEGATETTIPSLARIFFDDYKEPEES